MLHIHATRCCDAQDLGRDPDSWSTVVSDRARSASNVCASAPSKRVRIPRRDIRCSTCLVLVFYVLVWALGGRPIEEAGGKTGAGVGLDVRRRRIYAAPNVRNSPK